MRWPSAQVTSAQVAVLGRMRVRASLSIAVLAAWLAVGHLNPAFAQPAAAHRSLKVIYAYGAGNSGDALCRLVTDRLASRLAMSGIVENRAGASARIGTRAVIAAEPDGSTLLCSPMAPIVLHPVTYTNLGYDPFTALTPLSQTATFDISLTVGPAVPAGTLGELVTWLKANPDKAAYANPGLGGLPHFFALMFSTSAKIPMRNVPYRGGGPILNDILAGQLPMAIVPSADMIALHKAGKVRVLATSGPRRTPLLPDVPTFREAGYDIAGEGWYAFYGPAGMSPSKAAELSHALQAVATEPDIRDKLQTLGFVPTGTSGDTLAKIQSDDRALWVPAIKDSGFKPTD